ncbi:hypothetical protein KUCAC02_000728, partial [Chaenocephalus aceratus]
WAIKANGPGTALTSESPDCFFFFFFLLCSSSDKSAAWTEPRTSPGTAIAHFISSCYL